MQEELLLFRGCQNVILHRDAGQIFRECLPPGSAAVAVVAAIRLHAAFHRRWRTAVNTAESAVGTVFARHGGGIRQWAGRFLGLQLRAVDRIPFPFASAAAVWLSIWADSPEATAMLA